MGTQAQAPGPPPRVSQQQQAACTLQAAQGGAGAAPQRGAAPGRGGRSLRVALALLEFRLDGVAPPVRQVAPVLVVGLVCKGRGNRFTGGRLRPGGGAGAERAAQRCQPAPNRHQRRRRSVGSSSAGSLRRGEGRGEAPAHLVGPHVRWQVTHKLHKRQRAPARVWRVGGYSPGQAAVWLDAGGAAGAAASASRCSGSPALKALPALGAKK